MAPRPQNRAAEMPRRRRRALAAVGWIASALAMAAVPGPFDGPTARAEAEGQAGSLFARDNLVAWCIVPFDSKKRGPEDRAAMLQRLGFRKFAYDWRAEHIPTFDAEVEALKDRGVELSAFWVAPGVLNRESRIILDLLTRHKVRAQLWVLLDLGPDKATGDEQARRVKAAADQLEPLAREAATIGCTLALYNHGGWFGEPENQLEVIEALEARGVKNLGIVYNLHHGHDHLDRFPALLAKIKPRLLALNLNGMDPGGDKVGRKILPLGQGERDLELLKTIAASGYAGPIGILGHTDDDAEERLRDNLDGLDWLVAQLEGRPAGPKPTPRTPVPPRPAAPAGAKDEEAEQVAALIREAAAHGDPRRGAAVFASAKSGCLTCHKVGDRGGAVGPDLSAAGLCLKPDEVVASILWPARTVKAGYEAVTLATHDGRTLQGYLEAETDAAIRLRDPASGEVAELPRAEVEAVRRAGSLMPDGLLAAMTPAERRDLVRFLLDLGKPGTPGADEVARLAHGHAPATFPLENAPLRPEAWPSRAHPVNRDRIYDFYAKEAAHFRGQAVVPPLLPPFPGLDGGTLGHWGNQNEDIWKDDRWNRADLGNVLSGVFRGAGVTVPKGVCVRLGDRGELSACFNPETLRYEAVWSGGFVKFSATRHGFLDGLILDGTPRAVPDQEAPRGRARYRGFYRHGDRVVFAYEVDGVEKLDAPWVDADGNFARVVAPSASHPLAHLTRGGGARWPQVLATKGRVGSSDGPYAVDTIEPPFENPWNAPMFFGDHDFLPDGSALLCTMQGDVWRVVGLDESLQDVRWRRFASGLHQPLGLVVVDGDAHVLGRDQITRLRDLDGDGEADVYENVTNAYETSPAGHDFICGLQRDAEGRFYTASGKQGLLRIDPARGSVEVLATGLRNPDGLALTPDCSVTAPNSEGDWTPASMICEVTPGPGPGPFAHFGSGGPRGAKVPDLPLVYLPRGLDNSSGGQVAVPDDPRAGPLRGRMVHLSFGAGTAFLLLRDRVDGKAQGAVVPLPVEFLSGAHRGRYRPQDGQLYVSGMAGWGSYTPLDGCFQRVRFTGAPAALPTSIRAHENGVLLTFAEPLDRDVAETPARHFAQAWNYRYGPQYGSPEFSTRHPGIPGHDHLPVRSARVLDDGRGLFLELPDLQPVNVLHLSVSTGSGDPVEVFATVHALAPAFTGLPDYRPVPKTIAAHPILADMTALAFRPAPNPWRAGIPGARELVVEAGKNLSFSPRQLKAKAGEPLRLTFLNPDVVPHNWALIRPGTLAKVGDLANKLIAEPDAASRQYVPRTDDVLFYTDIVGPQEQARIHFRAPARPGRYPFLCTFPGHWMVMNGELVVE